MNLNELNQSRPVDEINIRCRKNAKAIYSKYFISDRERKELIKEIGDAACMLFEYYLRLASVGDVQLTDEGAAEYFGWSPQKAKRNRLALKRAGWFRQARNTFNDGRKGVSYYIGTESVRESGAKI